MHWCWIVPMLSTMFTKRVMYGVLCCSRGVFYCKWRNLDRIVLLEVAVSIFQLRGTEAQKQLLIIQFSPWIPLTIPAIRLDGFSWFLDDENRVLLSLTNGYTSDYINASYIRVSAAPHDVVPLLPQYHVLIRGMFYWQDYDGTLRYIASQGEIL